LGIATLGGTLAALEAGYQAAEIGDAAYRAHQAIEAGDAIVVGVNAFTDGSEIARPAPQQIDPRAEADQVSRLVAWRTAREPEPLAAALGELDEAARGTANVLPIIRRCAEAGATVGEIAAQLRSAWGEYRA
jgi:methylmalonyl-CoA mutase N-terminal domain/subunit